MFKKKTAAPIPTTIKVEEPTLHMRLLEAKVAATQATNIFVVAAENLDRASEELDSVAVAAEVEAEELLALVEEAMQRARTNRDQAIAIRTAMGVN